MKVLDDLISTLDFNAPVKDIRLISMGASKAILILRHEKAYLKRFFESVIPVKRPVDYPRS